MLWCCLLVLIPQCQKIECSSAIFRLVLMYRDIKLRIDTFGKVESIFRCFGRCFDCDKFIFTANLIQPKIACDGIKDSSIEVQIIAEEDVVSSERAIDLDLVMLSQVSEMERFVGSACGGDIKLKHHVDGIDVEAIFEMISGLGCMIDHVVIDVCTI